MLAADFGMRDIDSSGNLTRLVGRNWVTRVWSQERYLFLQGMARNDSGEPLGQCVMCDEGVDDTAGHFVVCEGEWAAHRRADWTQRIAAGLIAAELANDAASARRAAAAAWGSLTAQDRHWSSVLGFATAGHLTTGLVRGGARAARKNRHHRVLRRAMLEHGSGMWNERQRLLHQRARRRPQTASSPRATGATTSARATRPCRDF
jgi:hypothetical protein